MQYSGLDDFLIHPFYDVAMNTWPYKSYWLTSDVLHVGGRKAVVSFGAIILMVFVLSFFIEGMRSYRKGAFYLLIASLLGPAIVAIGKHFTHIYSPWDLKMFGGTEPYIRLFDMVPDGAKVGHAFPAGHSSGGFAFFSLYFLALEYKRPIRYYALFFALFIGFLFGITQQARGAHFFSHDLFSLGICWYSALIVYIIFFKLFQFQGNIND